MKRIIILSAVALAIASCWGRGAKERPVTIDSLSGEWVMSGYFDELSKTQSPMKTWEFLSGYSGISIGDAEDGRAFVLIMINNHEGISGYIYENKKGHEAGSYAFINDFDDEEALDIELMAASETLMLTSYDKDGQKTGERMFDFVADFQGINDPCGLAAVKVLLEGKWSLLDSHDNKVADIVIDSLGKVSGWGEYSVVTVATDAALGGEDEISVSTEGNRAAIWYIADFAGDSIFLYETLQDEQTPFDQRGKKVYTFVRNDVKGGIEE